jgi:hypothetical protein
MRNYPTLKIDGTEYSTIRKPVVLALFAGGHLEFDTVKRALGRIEKMCPSDPLPKNIYCFESKKWSVVKIHETRSTSLVALVR